MVGDGSQGPTCAVIMACFNRRATTLRSLASLYGQQPVREIRVYLVDDASTDGTAEAVLDRYPSVRLGVLMALTERIRADAKRATD